MSPLHGGKYVMNPKHHGLDISPDHGHGEIEHGESKKEPSGTDNPPGEHHGEPAHMVETHRHEDGSYHTVTHHADGSEDMAEHGSHEEAMDHQKQMFHEEPDNEMGEMEPDGDEGSDGTEMGNYESTRKALSGGY